VNETRFSELIQQALIIRTALEALAPIVAVLGCVALAAFIVYLIGAFRLCRAEVRPRRNSQAQFMESSKVLRTSPWSEARRGRVPPGRAYPRTHKVR